MNHTRTVPQALEKLRHLTAVGMLGFLVGMVVHADQSDQVDDFPWLSTLELGDWSTTYQTNPKIVKSGRKLANLAVGVHSLEQDQEHAPIVLIGIHGYGVHGFEWVSPFLELDSEEVHVHFYRWNSLRQNEKARLLLLRRIDEIIAARTAPLERIVVLAHSCGGVMAASAMKRFPTDVRIDLHTVAAPLNGLGLLTVCKPDLPESVPENVNLHQWRTTKAKDSVFWYFTKDPQIVTLQPSKTVRLPPKYLGIRLGHVRSISWVANQLKDDLSGNSENEPIAHSKDSS